MIKTSKWQAEIQAAFMLLTRLPVGGFGSYVPGLASARWAYPLVGFVVGGITALLLTVFHFLGVPNILAAILAVAGAILCTGALHEDGLADSADGLGGGGDTARKLEIMKDSRIGSYGVLALILVVGARIGAFADLQSSWHMAFSLISIAMLSRLVMVFYLEFLPAAREGGLGKSASESDKQQLMTAVILSAPAIIYIFLFVPAALVLMSAAAFGFARIAQKQIGGQTGDICGAGQQISETVALICLASVFVGA